MTSDLSRAHEDAIQPADHATRTVRDIAVLGLLAGAWSDEGLRAAYHLDTPGAPLEAALAAWEAAGYRRDGPESDWVLHVVDAIEWDPGPDCYPELFAMLREGTDG